MISQIMPNTKLLQEMKSRMPIGLYVNSDEVSEFLIANPFGFQTPFYILNDAFQSNEFVIVGNAEFSRNLVDWYPVEGGRLTLSGRDKMYIRYKGDGEVVEIVESQYHYSIGGNLFSLTRKEWGVDTPTQEVNNGTAKGEFEQYFMNQTNLIHARLLMLAFKTDPRAYNQLFKGCVNLEDIPVIVAEDCHSATYSSWLSGCSKVNEIICNIVTWQQYTDFSLGLPAMGKFYKRESAAIPQGKDGTPDGWEIIDVDTNHLGNQTPFWVKNLSLDDTNSLTFEGALQYSWDAKSWDDLTGQSGTLFPQQKVFLRTKPSSGSKVKITASTMPFEIGGNMFSLTRDEWSEKTKCKVNEFGYYFDNQKNLFHTKNLILSKYTDTNSFVFCFRGTPIEDLPILEFSNLVINALQGFIIECNALKEIRYFVNYWVPQAAFSLKITSKGTFYKYEGVKIPIGNDGIPRDWKLINVKREEKPFNPNPYGNATPFWVKNVGLGDNEIVLSGEYQFSINGKGWSDGKSPTLKLAEGQRMFIRTMPNGFSKVKIVSALRGYEIGGNLFSLTRDEWTEETQCEANEFKAHFADQQNLIFSDNVILGIANSNSYQSLFVRCKNIRRIPKIISTALGAYAYAFRGKFDKIEYLVDRWETQVLPFTTTIPNGTFTKYRGVDIPTGANGIPEGWDVVEIDPPTPTADTQPIKNA